MLSCVVTTPARGNYFILILLSLRYQLTLSLVRSSQVVQSNAGCDINIKVSLQPQSLGQILACQYQDISPRWTRSDLIGS